MAELPIVVEANAWLDIVFGIIMLLVTFVIVRGLKSLNTDGGVSPLIVGVFAALFTFGLGVSFLVRNLNWQFRLEENAVILQAPFDYQWPSAEIAWSEITSVYLSRMGNRGGTSFKLHIRGKPGTEIILAPADRLPAQFAMMLQKLLAERAPQAKGIGGIQEELDYARTHPARLAPGYSARNGRGELLQ